MTTVHVSLGPRSYDILIQEGALENAAAHLAPYSRGRLIIVSDENVWAAQGEALLRGLGPIQAELILVPPGESSKSWERLESLVDCMLALGLERSEHIAAFGGGVVGDLAGFASAIVSRGCGLVQIPTSLLAQVDSSVGGKTAINVAAGKNLVGAFHQPSLVLVDPACLATLEPRHLRAGYAEIVKYALIRDARFFGWLEEHGLSALAGDRPLLQQAIATSVAGKAAIVAADERETSGERALLNLGHTFGHAIEAASGLSDRCLHGEAVSVGIILAFDFSVRRGVCARDEAERVRAHFASCGLPYTLSELGLGSRGADLVRRMASDKKKRDGTLAFILARGIGSAFMEREVRLEDVEAFLDGHV